MQIDPLKQVATVQSQQGTQAQKKAVYQYNESEVERQRKLFEAGVISRQAYDQAIQAYQNSKGDYDSNAALTNTQKQQLAYYQIRAPFAGIVGDIPVHLGDYVSSTTLLTTVDENADLEAYIYIPTERPRRCARAFPSRSSIRLATRSSNRRSASSLLRWTTACRASSPRLRSHAAPSFFATSSSSRRALPGAPHPLRSFPYLPSLVIGGQTFVFVAQSKGDGYVAHQIAVTLGETVGNYLSRPQRPQSGRQSDHLRPAVSAGRCSRPASGLGSEVLALLRSVRSSPHRLSLHPRASRPG